MSARPNNAYGTPLPSKLGIKEGHVVAVVGAPDGFDGTLGELPDGVRVKSRAAAHLDVIVLFVRRRSELERRFGRLVAALQPAGGLWVAWPKRCSGVETDMTEDVAREIGLAHGLVDNKVCAIDETWSGLRLVRRLEDR
jgi:hypothetical protein